MKADVAAYLNRLIAERQRSGAAAVVNCAVEESTLGERAAGLLPHDELIRKHVRAGDVVVVSVGGNDIALRPRLGTIWNMLLLQLCNSTATIEQGGAWGMTHFKRLFHDELTEYLLKLCSQRKPRRIIVSMIYYPDEKQSGKRTRTAAPL